MKTIVVGAGSDLGVNIDGAHLGPVQLINDLKSFYQGEILSLLQDDKIIKSRNLSDRRKNEYEIDKFNTALYNKISEKINEFYEIDIPKKKIHLENDIKAFGTYKFEIKLISGIVATMSVMVAENV